VCPDVKQLGQDMNGLNDINTKLVCKLCTTMLRDVKSKTQTLKVSKLSPVRNIVYIDVCISVSY